MVEAKIIIGAGAGDEGKGIMTHYFAAEAEKQRKSCLVVLSNGGAQRGHTVVTESGISHTFHHFGSGTFDYADTFLPSDFILNPMTFVQEMKELKSLGFQPTVFSDEDIRWSTPFDIIANQMIEESRGEKRHGSCGMGIWETIKRYGYRRHQTSFWDFCEMTIEEQRKILEKIRDTWFIYRVDKCDPNVKEKWRPIIMNDSLIDHFIADCIETYNYILISSPTIINAYDRVIFENGQGLLIDQKFGDNSTPSNTGIINAAKLIAEEKFDDEKFDIEACYVTRTYLTRHGAGVLVGETDRKSLSEKVEDLTNDHNEWQGSLRYASLDVGALKNRIEKDAHMAEYFDLSPKITIAATHVDQLENKELLALSNCSYAGSGRKASDIISLI